MRNLKLSRSGGKASHYNPPMLACLIIPATQYQALDHSSAPCLPYRIEAHGRSAVAPHYLFSRLRPDNT